MARGAWLDVRRQREERRDDRQRRLLRSIRNVPRAGARRQFENFFSEKFPRRNHKGRDRGRQSERALRYLASRKLSERARLAAKLVLEIFPSIEKVGRHPSRTQLAVSSMLDKLGLTHIDQDADVSYGVQIARWALGRASDLTRKYTLVYA